MKYGYDFCETCHREVQADDLEPVEPDGELMCEDCWQKNGRPEIGIPDNPNLNPITQEDREELLASDPHRDTTELG